MVTWAGSFQGRRFLGCHFLDTTDLTAKFVVSRCAYCKLRRDLGFFCSVNHFSEGGVKANHNVTSSPSLAENDFRLFKNSEANHNSCWVDFCQRKESDVALFLLVTRIRKIRKICDYCPKRDGHKATSLETRNKQNGSKSTNHESQAMTFRTCASKHVFPKRSPQSIIDGTEKPKIPLKFAKRTARYNEFGYKVSKMRWRRR